MMYRIDALLQRTGSQRATYPLVVVMSGGKPMKIPSKQLWMRFKTFAKRKQLDRDLDDEIAFHLAMREQKNRGAGAPVDEAYYAARR